MDYYDEDPRPRFQLQASSIPAPQQSASIDRKHAAFCIATGILIFSYGCLLPGIWQILLTWIGLSLAIGPFAPISLTGGDIRVGCGEIIEEPQIETPKPEPERKNYRGKAKRSENSNPEIPILNIPRSDEIPEGNKNGEAGAKVSVVSRVSWPSRLAKIQFRSFHGRAESESRFCRLIADSCFTASKGVRDSARKSNSRARSQVVRTKGQRSEVPNNRIFREGGDADPREVDEEAV